MRLLVTLFCFLFSSQACAKPSIIIVLTDDQNEQLTMGNDPATGRPLLPKMRSLILDEGTRFTE